MTTAHRHPVFVSADAVQAVITMPALIQAMRAVYAQPISPANSPPRSVARGQGVWLRTLSAVMPTGRTMGAKVFASARVRGVGYLVTLFDQESGELLALVDGKHITAMRTAAASAVALESLLPPNSSVTLGVLGSGMEAQSHLEALNAVCRIASLKVFSPTTQNRERFAAAAQQRFGITAGAVASPEAAVEDASVILCAARARLEVPVLQGAWLTPGVTVISIGSTLPEQREVDAATIAKADLIVADMPEEIMHDTGDMLAARQDNIVFAHKVHSLNDAVRGVCHRKATEIAMYKSVGCGLQDLVAAELAYDEALRHRLATSVAVDLSIKRTPR